MIPGEWIAEPSSLLSGGSGIPSINGGDAGPSSASVSSSQFFNNAFSVASGQGRASATSQADQPSAGPLGLTPETIAFLAVMAVLASVVVRKKA